MRIGIFGGSFNPIHVGHLVLAETARETLALDRLVFIPAGQPPHKKGRDLAAGRDRLEMARLATQHHPAFIVSDIELSRPGASYSIDTVNALRRPVPQAKFFLLVGEDMLSVRWKDWAALKRACTVVAAKRPGAKGSRQQGLPAARHARLGRAAQAGVTWLPMPLLEISSTDIRKRAKAGRSIRYLVPSAVERYIRDHRLYQAGAKEATS